MKTFTNVLGSQTQISPLEINIDTVYVRTNIQPYETEEFAGWQYDETQYTLREYLIYLVEQDIIDAEIS